MEKYIVLWHYSLFGIRRSAMIILQFVSFFYGTLCACALRARVDFVLLLLFFSLFIVMCSLFGLRVWCCERCKSPVNCILFYVFRSSQHDTTQIKKKCACRTFQYSHRHSRSHAFARLIVARKPIILDVYLCSLKYSHWNSTFYCTNY